MKNMACLFKGVYTSALVCVRVCVSMVGDMHVYISVWGKNTFFHSAFMWFALFV